MLTPWSQLLSFLPRTILLKLATVVRLHKNKPRHWNNLANEEGLLVISRGTALVLLFVYIAYIVFQVSSFLNYRRWPLITLINVAENTRPTLCSRVPRERGGGRGRGRRAKDECFCGCLLVSHIELVLLHPFLRRILVVYLLSLLSPHFVLIIASILLFFGVEWWSHVLLSVVASIEEFAERYAVPKPFIGLILLPIVVSEYQILFSCQVKLSFQSRQMQLSMSLLYGWLWKIEWSLRSPSALEARLWVFFNVGASEPHLHNSLCK